MKNLYVKYQYVVIFFLTIMVHQLHSSEFPTPPGHIERYYDEAGALHLRWVDHFEHEVDKYFASDQYASPQSMADLKRHFVEIQQEMARRTQQCNKTSDYSSGATPKIAPPNPRLRTPVTPIRLGSPPTSLHSKYQYQT